MDKIAIIKKTISILTGIGTAKIVAGIIENNVDIDTTTSKVSVKVASTAIGYAVSDNLTEYTDFKIDELVSWWNERKTKTSSK